MHVHRKLGRAPDVRGEVIKFHIRNACEDAARLEAAQGAAARRGRSAFNACNACNEQVPDASIAITVGRFRGEYRGAADGPKPAG
jgi:hypothetical protein